MSERPEAPILVVEDDPGHARLVEKNLRRAGVTHEIRILRNGREACEFLFSEGRYAGAEPVSPVLMLLDLNMPVLDGYGVLERVRADERTRYLPVVVLTTTEDEQEVDRCYRLGCNLYLSKPVDYEQFQETVLRLGQTLMMTRVPEARSMIPGLEGTPG